MLNELARMSCDDGLVMQLHIGSLRDYNRVLAGRFGPDIGADIPGRDRLDAWPTAPARCLR